MSKIVSYIKDNELEKKFTHSVRERSIEQKFLYTDPESAHDYYKMLEEKKKRMGSVSTTLEDDYALLKKVISKDESFELVSLGCGNAVREYGVLKKLSEEGYTFTYIGVDISKPMLEMAKETLKDIDVSKEFVVSDIANETFKDELGRLTSSRSKKVFAFLGGTLGNVNQTNIADVIYDTLSKGDMLWLEVAIRPDTSMETDMKIFNRYAQYLENDNITSFYFHPLSRIKLPRSSGKIILKSSKESSVGALLFAYYFRIEKKTVITHNNETIHMLPGEEIKLQSNRVYHPETLTKFFIEHEFNLIDKHTGTVWGQILLKK